MGAIKKLHEVFFIFDNACPETNLSHFRVFTAVAEKEGITMPDLCKHLEMPQGSLSRIVKDLSTYRISEVSGSGGLSGLKGHGVLEVKPDAIHRKRFAVYLTEKGENLRDKIEATLSELP
jgi:DNA-binding MarR family transcriptional regulator